MEVGWERNREREMHVYKDGRTDGLMEGLMDGWMDGPIDKQVDRYLVGKDA